jgi:hypothetical protein
LHPPFKEGLLHRCTLKKFRVRENSNKFTKGSDFHSNIGLYYKFKQKLLKNKSNLIGVREVEVGDS